MYIGCNLYYRSLDVSCRHILKREKNCRNSVKCLLLLYLHKINLDDFNTSSYIIITATFNIQVAYHIMSRTRWVRRLSSISYRMCCNQERLHNKIIIIKSDISRRVIYIIDISLNTILQRKKVLKMVTLRSGKNVPYLGKDVPKRKTARRTKQNKSEKPDQSTTPNIQMKSSEKEISLTVQATVSASNHPTIAAVVTPAVQNEDMNATNESTKFTTPQPVVVFVDSNPIAIDDSNGVLPYHASISRENGLKKRQYDGPLGYEAKRPRMTAIRPLQFRYNPTSSRFYEKELSFDDYTPVFVPENDIVNESTLVYNDLKSKCTATFRDKHTVSNHQRRKQLLEFSKRLLAGNMSYSENILNSNTFLKELCHGLGPLARIRFDQMVRLGYFLTGSKKCRTNSIILSKKEEIVLQLTKLSNSLFEFNLKIEVNPLLSRHLGKNACCEINHFSSYRLY